MSIIESLLETALFDGAPHGDLAELASEIHRVQYRRGQLVWGEGADASALFVVVDGQLKAYRISADGSEVILQIVVAPGLMGEAGLFHPSGRRQVCVGAMTATTCLMIPRDPLFDFMMRHPVVMRRMLESLSTVAVHAAYSFSGVAFDDIRGRVARALVKLASEHGELVPDGTRVRLTLSQTALAALIAASRENVNRALVQLGVQGLVSQRDGQFVVHDLHALRAIMDDD